MSVERNYVVHPQYLIIGLILAGITALFLGFSGAYLYTRIEAGTPPIELPSLFYYNTILLIIASFCLVKAKKAYLSDNTVHYQIYLVVTLILTTLFLVMQLIAWQQLYNSDIFLNYNNMASYMYLISGLHFAHVVAGIPFLAWFVYVAYKRMKEPVSVLIYFSDPDKQRRLSLLTIYWHFLDGLWIYLVIFFLANYLIQ